MVTVDISKINPMGSGKAQSSPLTRETRRSPLLSLWISLTIARHVTASVLGLATIGHRAKLIFFCYSRIGESITKKK
jgi:hypothetical protein